MHELGLCAEMVHTVEGIMENERLNKITKIKVQIGEITGVLPRFMQECWVPACEGSKLEGSELEIDFIPAKAICRKCGEEYHPILSKPICPKCGSTDYDFEEGFEFEIIEISGE